MQCKWSGDKTTGIFICDSAKCRLVRQLARYTMRVHLMKNER